MEGLKIFENVEFGKVRVVEVNGDPWFVGKDVAIAFGDKNHNRSLGRLDDEDKRVVPIIDNLGRTQQITVINESGLYALLFAMQPQKANNDGESDAYPIEVQERIGKLHRFKRWVTAEVLPSIRKHGMYAVDQLISNPDLAIQAFTALKEEREQRKALESQIEKDAPKVLFADAVAASRTSILTGELAKLLKQNGVEIGQNRLFAWLRDNGYLIRRKGSDYNMPTQKSMEMELFEVKERTIHDPNGSVRVIKTPKVTGKGQQYFINKFLGVPAQ